MTPYFALDVIIALGAATVVIVAPDSDKSDMVAVLGSMLATVIATLEARKKDRSLANTVIVLIGSAFCGSIMPGAVLFNWYPDLAFRLTWHAWAGLGFFCGLVGWGTMQACVFAFNRLREKWIAREEERLAP